jgi:hypothetical protein
MKLSKIVAAVKGQTEDEEKALRNLGWSEKAIDNMSARQMEIIIKRKTKPRRSQAQTVQADQQVAKTILQQMGGINRLRAMLGTKQFVTMKDGVQFKFPSPHGGPNFVKIVLDPSDTYTMTFGRVRGTQFKKGKEHAGIYADQLRKIFEKETGLYLKL